VVYSLALYSGGVGAGTGQGAADVSLDHHAGIPGMSKFFMPGVLGRSRIFSPGFSSAGDRGLWILSPT